MIESHSHIAPGAVVCGKTKIGDSSHVGAGSVLIQGLSIGDNAFIAAGSVVIENIEDDCKVKGNPAKKW